VPRPKVDGGPQFQATEPPCKRDVLADQSRFSRVLHAGIVEGTGLPVARGDGPADIATTLGIDDAHLKRRIRHMPERLKSPS
jgi:hypothetical protein